MREIKKEVLEEPQPLETEGYQIYHIKEEDVEEDHRVDGENKDLQKKPQPEGQQVPVVKQEYKENHHETVAKGVVEEVQHLETEGYQIYHIKEEDVEEDHSVDGETKDMQEKHQSVGQQIYTVKQEYLHVEDLHGLDDEALHVDLAEGIVEESHSSGTEGYRIFFMKEEDSEDDQAEMQISSSEQDVNPQPKNNKLDLGSNQLPLRGDKEKDGSSGYEPETEVGSWMSNTSKRNVRSTKPRAESLILRQDGFIILVSGSGVRLNAELQTPVQSSLRESSCFVDNSGFRHIPNEGGVSQQHQEAEEDPVNIPSSYHEWEIVNESKETDSEMHELQQSLQYPDCDELDTMKSDVIVRVKTHTADNPHSLDSSEDINLSRHLRTHTQQCYQETHIAEVGSPMSNTGKQDVRRTKPGAESQILKQDSFIIPVQGSRMQLNAELQTPVYSSPREISSVVDNSGFKHISNEGCGSQQHQEAEEDPVNIPSSYHELELVKVIEQTDSEMHELQQSLQYPDCHELDTIKSDAIVHVKTRTAENPLHSSGSSEEINLSRHLRTHTQQCYQEPHIAEGMSTPTGENSCPYCNKIFSCKSKLSCHIRTHTGEKPHHCVHCNKKFNRQSDLLRHIRTHTGEKPHQCVHCNKKFASHGSLAYHIRTHTGEKPHQCVLCNKKFAQQSALTCHVRTHTGEKPYHCVHCNKKFAQQYALTLHVRNHTGEKPHQCVHCNKKFAKQSDLLRHIRTHTGEKPHQCVHCDKKFARQYALTLHVRNHTGEKPHQCVHCDKKFARQSNLSCHIRIHTGEKPF